MPILLHSPLKLTRHTVITTISPYQLLPSRPENSFPETDIGVGKGLPQTFRYTTNSTSRATGHNVVTELEQVSQIRTLAE